MRPAAERARQIREVLKQEFPGAKFSVRSDSYTGGSAVNISWTDGPKAAEVEGRIQQFETVHYDEHTGEILSGGNSFVFCNRSLSPNFYQKIVAKAGEMYVLPEHGRFHPWQLHNAEEALRENENEVRERKCQK